MFLRHRLTLALILVAAWGCSNRSKIQSEPVFVSVSAGAKECTAGGAALRCSDLATYLAKTMAIPHSRPVAIAEEKPEGNDSALIALAGDLRTAGYSQVVRVEFISEPK
jgi:hypothetical protein